jgi:DNA (cytosine-5)-methyltransferase 1
LPTQGGGGQFVVNPNERITSTRETNNAEHMPDIKSGVQKRGHGAFSMRYFSMFSGIGGFEKGIEDAFSEDRRVQQEGTSLVAMSNGPLPQQCSCIGFSELDKNAINIYKKQYPEHKGYGDATKINGNELPDFDLLVGGFPCQAFSIAGLRRGMDDTRGTLFFDIARILREKRPGQFLLENVKGLLSHDEGRTFKTIITTLAEVGYIVEWEVLNSKNFGVPQNRERVFIHGFREGCGGQIFPLGSTDGKVDISVKIIAHKDGYRRNRQTFAPDGITEALDTAQGGGRGHHTAIRINEGVAEETKDEALCITKSYHKGFDNHGQRTGIAIPVLTPDRIEKRQNGRRFKEDGEDSFTVTAIDQHGIYNGFRIRRLTPVECERLQGFPDDWTKYGSDGKTMSDSARYKACGNAVTTNVIRAVIEKMFETDIAMATL